MISVSEARSIIQQNIRSLPPQIVALQDAVGLTLAQEVTSPNDIPAYAQSSMDGYALRFTDRNNELTITGEMPAGVSKRFSIGILEAARIFTGAPLPDGADTVLMQENAIVKNGKLLVNDAKLSEGLFVRPQGSEIKKGEVAMPANTTVTVGAIGFLAGIGIETLSVFSLPSVAVILTGNELQKQGTPLEYGKVYDSNSFMLAAALRIAGIKHINVLKVADNLTNVEKTLENAIRENDLVLLTGGVSVGDYDFVVEAATKCGIDQKFHRIKQKPGKPLFFGMKGDKPVFGLPGNPSSALSCYLMYVLPAIRQMAKKISAPVLASAILEGEYSKGASLTHFLKSRLDGDKVRILHAQESYRLHSFAQADSLVELREGQEHFRAGDAVPVHLLRFEL